jgi:predicted flap endonuclease-1-like 5' DNA nuclease
MSREEQGLYAEFHLHPVLQPEESHKQGRPVHKDELYIQIQIKGQKNQIRDRKSNEQDKTDFPKAWTIWNNKEKELVLGTPLSAIPGIGPSMELELKQLGIHTVEDMAALTDATMDKFRGARMLKQRAVAYLEAIKIFPEPEEQPEKTETDEPVDIALMNRSADVIPAPKRGPGRPRKVLQ